MTKIFCRDCKTLVAEFYGNKAPTNLENITCQNCGSGNLKVESLLVESKKVAFDIFINNKDSNENIHEGFLFELGKDDVKEFQDKAVKCFVKMLKNNEQLKRVIGEKI